MILKRISHDSDGTYGVLIDGHLPFAVTLERPWQDNRPNLSCIPDGIYECRRIRSPKFGNTFEVAGVEGRSGILFHKGNTSDDTEGCILVGERFGSLEGRGAVLSSRQGFEVFMERLAGVESFVLSIVWV